MNTNFVNGETFYGKLLLFGEYSVLSGGSALTVPLRRFSGRFVFHEPKGDKALQATASNRSLNDYMNYLHDLSLQKKLPFEINTQALRADIENGMYFQSDIPQGYGAGSSGALVAAVYSRYMNPGNKPEITRENIPLIRRQLAIMESWFHGSSSGLDPLTCLLARPLLVKSGENITTPFDDKLPLSDRISLFLLDTRITGKTEPLVDWFKSQAEALLLNEELLRDLSNETIKTFLSSSLSGFSNYLSQLSLFQLENMRPMIPDGIRKLWEKGLNSQTYTLKLCGSGGGGFVLGFTSDMDASGAIFHKNGFEVISV